MCGCSADGALPQGYGMAVEEKGLVYLCGEVYD